MDFAFSDEQNMLREQARSFLADKSGLETVADIAVSDEGWDKNTYRQIAELGWIGLSIPESAGGAGMGFIEEAVLFEEMGRALLPGPYFSTVGLALPALADAGDLLAAVLSGERTTTLAWAGSSGAARIDLTDGLTAKAEESSGAWTITGEKVLVPDTGIVDGFLVVAAAAGGPGIWWVARGDCDPRVSSTMDRTRRLGSISMSGAPAELIAAPDRTRDLLTWMRLRALAAASLEAVGIAQRALELSVDHVKERKQFDKPIGSYQAVSHQVVDIYMDLELARSLAYWAAWCVAERDDQARSAVAAAKAAASQAAITSCERAIQVHGGIGFTWEHPLHLFYKRAHWINTFEGPPGTHRETIAADLLD